MMKKPSNNKKKSTSKLGLLSQKLTKTEKDILHLLTTEFLTPNKIATRRQTTVRAVNHHIKKLRLKGALKKGFQILPKNEWALEVSDGIRLHGMEFNINILFQDNNYKSLRNKGNLIYVDGNTIRLYTNSIEVYGVKSFFGDTVQAATSKAFNYWSKFFVRLEDRLKVELVKNSYNNVSLVKAEYAEIHNELARDCGNKADKLKVYARDDGKLWFLIDNSFNLHEAETVHRESGKRDMVAVSNFFNDLRENPVNLSEVVGAIALNQHQIEDVTKGLNAIVKLLTPLEVKKEEGLVKPFYVG